VVNLSTWWSITAALFDFATLEPHKDRSLSGVTPYQPL